MWEAFSELPLVIRLVIGAVVFLGLMGMAQAFKRGK